MNTNDTQLNKNFDRQEIESKWQKIWEDNDIFRAGTASNLEKTPYVIMMPPPNVTGVLHNGHALFARTRGSWSYDRGRRLK